jgi:hypothetical protein
MSLSVLLAAAAAAGAPQPADVCAARTLDYAAWTEAAGQQWDYVLKSGDGKARLTIVGAEHSRDAANPQFARIVRDFAAAAPTLAFYEGPDRGTRADEATAIAETGESGLVRFLAAKHGAQVRSLEPSPPDQLKALLASFPPDQVMLFFILREAARMRDREGLNAAALDGAVSAMLEKVAPMAGALGLAEPLTDLPSLDRTARKYWPDRDWRTFPSNWFSPSADDKATGGIFLGAINRADSLNRDKHMYGLIAAALRADERVFVAVGRNHVPMIAPALDCAFRARG